MDSLHSNIDRWIEIVHKINFKNCSSRIKLISNLDDPYLIDEIDEDLTYAPSTVEILEISKRADKTKNIKWSGTIMEHRSCFIKFGRK